MSTARQQLLAASEGGDDSAQGPVMEGVLELWSNYATGWRPRWLAIEHGPCTRCPSDRQPAATCTKHRALSPPWVRPSTGMLFIYKDKNAAAAGTSQGSVRLVGATLLARKVRARVRVIPRACLPTPASSLILLPETGLVCVYQDEPRCFLLRGHNSVSYSFRAPTEAVRAQWLRKLAQTGRRAAGAAYGVDPSTAARLQGAGMLGRRVSTGTTSGDIDGALLLSSSPSETSLMPSAATAAAALSTASRARADGEPVYPDSLETMLATLRTQRQSLERMLREAAAIISSDERLVQLRCVLWKYGGAFSRRGC